MKIILVFTEQVGRNQNKGRANDHPEKISHVEQGKTKKFAMERMLTIFQFFLSHF